MLTITGIRGPGLFAAVVVGECPSVERERNAPGFAGVQLHLRESQKEGASPSGFDAVVRNNSERMMKEGQQTFRFDTFGSEAFWGDALQLHKAIAGEKNGGVGGGVSPKTALSVGLKVDSDALPDSLKQQLKAGKVDLDDPATTLALLKLNSVVGVTGMFDKKGSCNQWASSAPSVMPPWMTRWRLALGSAWTAGPTGT